MKKRVLAAVAAVAFAYPASAAVITLQSITNNGPNNFTFNYQGTLGPDEGLRPGDRLVIFDFAGYVANSISVGSNASVTASVENTSNNVILTPGQTDDPNIPNLVFTYTGPAFQTSGGPFASIDFSGLSARSTLGGTKLDAFFTLTTKNNPAAEAGTAAFQIGTVRVPTAAAVPEPATWAMMLGGFGLLGAASRRRTRMTSVAA
ncbi:PEPxxWA-CTERM sorting domain-containing protein [Sphingomonas tabacisoli]|uniref:PEPxxWA-CTERM sorting domain-containing protein n=1 Tax=Sphingomonas tabacisoli TaxID=2249466 RepID=A0ABW4I574_9SPHN